MKSKNRKPYGDQLVCMFAVVWRELRGPIPGAPARKRRKKA